MQCFSLSDGLRYIFVNKRHVVSIVFSVRVTIRLMDVNIALAEGPATRQYYLY
jgi:hypothetical protein